MIQLLRNAVVYRDGAWRPSDILVADKRIERIDDAITCDYDGLVGTDCRGMTAIPGYIDQHVHLTGGGGEGSFITQVPPLKYSEPVKAGVTTMVGLLGTDGTTRSVANLVARTKAFRESASPPTALPATTIIRPPRLPAVSWMTLCSSMRSSV